MRDPWSDILKSTKQLVINSWRKKNDPEYLTRARRQNSDSYRKRYASDSDFRARQKINAARRYRARKLEITQRVKTIYAMRRWVVLKLLGAECKCCGEREPDFLHIDHVQNDGFMERRLFGNNFSSLARRIEKSVNDGTVHLKYQLLCANCNFSKRISGGVCAHKKIL